MIEELNKTLDAISEANKLVARGTGDLADTCYICGVTPSGLKAIIATIIQEAKIEELESIKAKQFWAADDAFDAGDVIAIKDIDERIKELQK